MRPEELKKQAQDVLNRYPEAKYVIAFSDGNIFLDKDKNAAELHAASSKRTPQRFDREEQNDPQKETVEEDDPMAGSTATDELAGKPAEEPVTEEPATEPVTEEPAQKGKSKK